ncbi:MFS transporter [Oceaniradius stylonematis]|jgi:MFS transporter, FSR family, fosmidomycin resistance protein|uniref:MFS transporter n=1 Tax=Oceaniradius stylonematis TaxID=2184161 RepID=A0A3A8ADL2_9HYPH|nr:MFS transporter [Oceaniradius stylonematis]RKF07448.1 MFS transporter [Oceaniradius stylonematis]
MPKRTLLTWFVLGHLANDWPIASLWLIVPVAGMATGLTPAEVGLLFTVFNVGGALAYLPAGILADHVSNRGRLLVATFWWVAAGYGLAALASGFWSLALLLALAGMGNAAWHPIATGVLTHDSRERRAQALGVHAIGGSLAEVCAPLAAGILLAHLDWRSALAVSVVPTVLLGVCFIGAARAIPRVQAKTVRGEELLGLLRQWHGGDGLRIVAMICLYNMALIAMLSMIPLYLADAHDMTPAAIGIVFSALLVAGALMQPWVGLVSDRAGRKPVLTAGNLVAGLACVVLCFGPAFWPMLIAMAVAVAALDAIRAAMLAAAVDQTGRSEGTTLGLAFVLMDGIGALGAVLAGLAAGFSWPHMFALAALLSIGSAVLAAAGRSPNRRCARGGFRL